MLPQTEKKLWKTILLVIQSKKISSEKLKQRKLLLQMILYLLNIKHKCFPKTVYSLILKHIYHQFVYFSYKKYLHFHKSDPLVIVWKHPLSRTYYYTEEQETKVLKGVIYAANKKYILVRQVQKISFIQSYKILPTIWHVSMTKKEQTR